ncbi:MAG: S8 family serine peptidase [Burkholderiaceae bacterium]
MVKPKPYGAQKLYQALAEPGGATLSRIAGVHLAVARHMSGGAQVLRFDAPIRIEKAREVAARMMAGGEAASVEPDRIMHASAPYTPGDPLYQTYQWHYMAPATYAGGANLPNAWSVTKGDAGIVVALLDTGIRPHEDLSSGSILPGYDFMTNFSATNQPRSNDGSGRDADPADPGDYALPGDFCYDAGDPGVNDSSWHGTHVAGTLIAAMDNAKGGTGVAPGVRLLPVRVLGTCGALSSDIIDAMRWAVGLAVPNAPANPTPANILNMSLGGAGACSPAYQSAVDDVMAAGATIFAATGNGNTIAVEEPANCRGVVAVTAHAIDGDVTNYANIGPETALSAPGGGCGDTNSRAGACNAENTGNNRYVLSTYNKGKTVPDPDQGVYAGAAGTSMAVPHAAGVAALMLSRDNTLTPARVRSYLQLSARAFPAGAACLGVDSYVGNCGAGLLDAERALSIVDAAPPAVNVDQAVMIVAPGTRVALSASAEAGRGHTLGSTGWSQTGGASVGALSVGGTPASASFTAPATGKYAFTFSATDEASRTSSAAVRVIVNSPPVPSSVAPQSVITGQSLRFTLAATDADGDTPVFTAAGLPPGATLSPDGVFDWPSAAAPGDYLLSYYASDAYADSPTSSVTIHVTPAPSGGGGGMNEWSLAMLGMLAAGMRVARRRGK